MVDKDLFLHDLSIVAILKNEGHYLKEWLDYHLLAGVDHFYLYDNDSTDNQAEVAAPYVEAGLVDYLPLPGKKMQVVSYNDAVKKFKFQSRYMAFIDCDEFIYPRLTARGIADIVDESLSKVPNANGLAVNWQCFGSNGQEKADYTRGVLERFTRRAPRDWYDIGKNEKNRRVQSNGHVKVIANPRKIAFIKDMHKMDYFNSGYSVNTNLKPAYGISTPIASDKIVINHYQLKSLEEYLIRRERGLACADFQVALKFYDDDRFSLSDRNDEFDDEILKYREERAKVYRPPDNSHVEERLLSALERNLSQQTNDIETLLTCRAVAAYLQEKDLEEAALKATLQALANAPSVADKELFKCELPKLLELPYPVVEELRKL